MTTTAAEVTAAQRCSVLGHIAKGRTLAFTAGATGTPAALVQQIADDAGYPNSTAVYKTWADLKRQQEAAERSLPLSPFAGSRASTTPATERSKPVQAAPIPARFVAPSLVLEDDAEPVTPKPSTTREQLLALASPAPSLAGAPHVPPPPADPPAGEPEPEEAPDGQTVHEKLLAIAAPAPSLGPAPQTADTTADLTTVRVDALTPDPGNPRERLTDILDLADSMKQVGLVQPIVARRSGARLIIVAGHRRHAAAKVLGWDTVSVLIRRELRPDDVLAAMLAENGQRKDLDPIEEARAIRRLIREQRLASHALAAERLGRAASFVSARLALLDLPEREQELLRAGEMTIGEAVALGRKTSGKTPPHREPVLPYFGATHPLASRARAHCRAAHHSAARLPGGAACGSCWETTIRNDLKEN